MMDDPDQWTVGKMKQELRLRGERIEELERALWRIGRTTEMSANIMRDPERTGNWRGAENVARAFERISEQARAALEGKPAKWCSWCKKDNHNDSECWSTRVVR